MYFTKYKGAGARKIYYIIAKAFCGVTERKIQTFLNRQQINQQIHPSFKNKQKLKPITSKEVMNRIQMDIVDMMRNPVEISKDEVYRYKNHFYKMKGDVGMSGHEKERKQEDAYTKIQTHS